MELTQEHAIARIEQISDICLTKIAAEQERVDAEIKMVREAGFEVDDQFMQVTGSGGDFYTRWNKLIEFYSKFL